MNAVTDMPKKPLMRAPRDAKTLNDPRWARILARDAKADGTFYYSVATTGVYCRPACPARLARPENVRFHATCADAEKDGFRPCKRCKPNQISLAARHAAMVTRACRIIEQSETVPALDPLAEQVGMSAYHFHRIFKRVTGVTPKDYAAAHREKTLRQALSHGRPVTAAIFEAGYNSSSRFYETSDAVLGMTPTKFKAGGQSAVIHFAVGQCSLGAILVAQSQRGICAILLGSDPEALARDLQDRFPKAELIGGNRAFERVISRVVGFVDDPHTGFDLPLDVRGTTFQKRVWKALREIPAGATSSYSEIAARLGAPAAARAVASACAANTLAVAIPCHRVVRRDGGLSGYRWGVERKRALLKKERRA